MSATSGTQASTNKGETTSSKSSKSGYDHLDINKLYKGKQTEPAAKTVTQKHGMQALGKALPARRGGSTVVKAEPSSTSGSHTNNTSNNNNDVANSSLSSSSAPQQLPLSSQQQQQKPPHNLGQQPPHPSQYPHHHHHQQPPPGWQQQQQNSSQSFPPPGAPQQRPPGPASPHHPHHPQHHHPLHNSNSSSAQNAAKTGGGGPPGSMHDKNWSGGQPPDMLNSNSRGGPPGKDQRNFPPPSSMAAVAAQESMQRFAQEFPSLDSGGGDGKGGSSGANAGMSKNNQDNQYGPGPILRPQTEGSWTQGGGRGMPRPPGPPPPSSSAAAGGGSSTRDFGPGAERPNMGGPTPPPMSLGPGGHPPPPLGAFPMQFPPRPPYMYPNSGPGGPPGGPGPGFYPPGPGGMPNPRFGMPIPPGAPPPSSHPQDGSQEGGPPPRRQGRGPPPGGPMRPASHFTSKPIIKAEELERMDELGQQEGGWSTVQDDFDYNKKLSFSDDEGQEGGGRDRGDKENSRGSGRRQQQDERDRIPRESRGDRERGDFRDEDIRDSRDQRQQQQQSRPMKILERPQMNDPRDQRDSMRDRGDRERESRGDPRDRYGGDPDRDSGPPSGRFQNDYDNSNDQEDWKRKPAPGFDRGGDRDRDGGRGPLSQQNRGGRMNRPPPPREEEESSWRSGGNNRSSNFDDDPRKKSSQGPLSGRGGDRGERERGGPPSNERSSGGGQSQGDSSSGRRGPPERGQADGPPGGGQQRGGGGGGGGGGAGDFGPASGPFQTNLPPRLQQRYHPPMFSQQQDRNNQRKTPSPVPSGNAVNKDRDFRDRSDRDWDRNDRNDRDRPEPQRPAYKILERNRGDSESSKDSSSHRELNRGSRFVAGGTSSNNDCDTVPVRLHRDSKDSTKRLSSDSGRLLMDDDSLKISPKQREDLDSMDSSYDSLRGSSNNKQDDGGSSNNKGLSSSSFSRTRPPHTSSWADEVADDQDYNSSDMDGQGSSRKGSIIRDLKRGDHQIHPEERRPPREMPRRVIIQQTKVENMKSDIQVQSNKPEPPTPEPKQPVEPVKIEKPIVEAKAKSYPAWGDRDSLREKSKSSGDNQDGSSKDGSVSKEGSERDSHSSEKETGGKDDGRKGEHGKNDVDNDKGHGGQQGSREKLDGGRGGDRDRGHYDNRYGGRYDKGGSRDIRLDRDNRDNRQKPRRMDSYEQNKQQQQSRDNRTPDRDTREYGGRSSQEKDRGSEKGVEKSKSGDRLDKGDQKEKGDKEDYRDDRRNDRDDYDRGHRSGGRGGKERGGYGVYQPRGGSHSDRDRGDRGGWGRDDGRDRDNKGRGPERTRGGRGGSSSGRDFYDKPGGRGGRMDSERGGDKEESHHQDKDRNKDKDTASDLSNKGSVEDLGREKGKGDRGKDKGSDREQRDDKGKRSPGTQRRNNNNARGGARLQGYGPPSDKTPFSSGQSGHGKDEQDGSSSKREGGGDQPQQQQQNSKPAPVPLMALGDISPPNMQSKGGRGGPGGRDLGERGGSGRGGRGAPQRMQRDDYSRDGFRGAPQREQDRSSKSGGGRSGRGGGSGDAKPLMSINSNEVEGNEWESGESIDSGEDDSKRSTGGGPQSRKDGGGSTSQQDSSNEASKKKSSSSTSNKSAGSGQQQQTSQQDSQNKSSGSSASSKDRRIKNPPYDPRPNSNKNQSGGNGGNTWDSKTMVAKDNSSGTQQQPIGTHSNTSTPALQDGKDGDGRKASGSPATNLAVGSGATSAPVVDNMGPLKTMVFENTNFKSINSSSSSTSGAPPSSGKAVGGGKGTIGDGASAKKDGGLGDLGGFTFGKVDDSTEIGFGTFNEAPVGSSSGPQMPPSSVSTSGPSSVPKPIGQPPRGYSSSHQPSPISPQAADLNEKVQSVKRIWEPMPPVSSMPSVQEQSGGGGSVSDHQDNSFHSGFGSDTFKENTSAGRDQFGSLPQGPTSGYAPGTSPALSAISKPESSSSPTSSNLRMSKQPQQQQQQVESSQMGGGGSGQISSSPFGGYTIQQGSNAFGGMPAVPSPPSVMYGTSQTLHAAATTGPHSGIYQAFPDAHQQVINASGRAGYGQFPTHPSAATSGQYGLFLSGVSPMDYQSMNSYQQHQQSSQGQQGGQTSRISPGPMTTTGGGNSGVIMSSTSSLMNAMNKPPGQQGAPGQNHPSMGMSMNNPQQAYSQMSHHHPGAAIGSHPPHSHPQAPPPHHLGPVGPAKPGGYSQGGGLGTPSQTPVFIPYDPGQHQQSVINLGGQNFLSSAMSRGTGPPPPQTPPVQALQSSSYYSASSGNQSGVFAGQGSNQAAGLQQLHVAVAAPNPQPMQGYHSSLQGLQYQTQLNLQGYNQQAAASTVSALNLGSQLMRNPGPPQSAYMKQQPGLELMGGGGLKSSHEQSLINQNSWNSYSLNQAYAAAAVQQQQQQQQQQQGKAPGSNPNDGRGGAGGNAIGGQRKGNNIGGQGGGPPPPGAIKYMSQGPGAYSGQVQQQ